jgi:hypothetical protein
LPDQTTARVVARPPDRGTESLVETVQTNPATVMLEHHWAFAGKNDAIHAAEIARGLLARTSAAIRWRLWLYSEGELITSQTSRLSGLHTTPITGRSTLTRGFGSEHRR